MKSRRSPAARLLVLATAVGLLLAGAMMYVAWQHNPQGEFHQDGVIRRAWITLGLGYFALPFVPAMLIFLVDWMDRRRRRSRSPARPG